ncbi:Retrovirus-related Pol polyprotein [Labeo rohita]|uniref:Retrovirus-related Pol polyprotein n=1 Tax=Labeo rohita TaxID=84645 RepID=A0ABQ8MWI1_LABRO|nr:Retrovirus-related Pol polyprotein [Labeo rohita]
MPDHFTKLAHAFPCVNQKAKQISKKLCNHVFCIYSFPTRIHMDQGTNFESTLIAELLKLAGIEKSHTTAYHPMGNGGTERFNWTLGSMLRSLPLKEKHKWPEQIQTLTFAYNATVNKTTGYAPFQLMFGRIPKLPVDVILGQVLHDPVIVDHGSYAKTLMSYLHEAARIAQKHTEKEQKKQAKSYNRKVKGTCLNIGDRVLLANKSERGKKKLADNFLPIELPPDDKDIQFNAENMETESCRSELSGSSEEGSSEDGTRAWVLDGQDEFEGQGPVDDDDLKCDHSIQSQRSVCEQDLIENEAVGGYPDEVSGIETESPADDPNSQTQTVNDPHADSIPDTQAQIPTDIQGVRTHAGRVVKKVSRLIESMAHRPFHIQRVGPSMAKSSGSILSLF